MDLGGQTLARSSFIGLQRAALMLRPRAAEYLPNRLMSKFGSSPILSGRSTEWRVRGYLSYTATSNPVVRSCSGLRGGQKTEENDGDQSSARCRGINLAFLNGCQR